MHTKEFLILVEFLKKTDYNANNAEIESKIPSNSGLAINAALNAIENEIPDVSS